MRRGRDGDIDRPAPSVGLGAMVLSREGLLIWPPYRMAEDGRLPHSVVVQILEEVARLPAPAAAIGFDDCASMHLEIAARRFSRLCRRWTDSTFACYGSGSDFDISTVSVS